MRSHGRNQNLIPHAEQLIAIEANAIRDVDQAVTAVDDQRVVSSDAKNIDLLDQSQGYREHGCHRVQEDVQMSGFIALRISVITSS